MKTINVYNGNFHLFLNFDDLYNCKINKLKFWGKKFTVYSLFPHKGRKNCEFQCIKIDNKFS
jgi:hypothetical protein